jgi:hypothetical protein
MKHAREDYNRIQDPAGLIPEAEPVFLIRAQDVTAPAVVEHWADLAAARGASNEIVIAAREQAMRMLDWQRLQKVKIPDLP